MAAVESISLEETNKIRISLGLKPLTDDKAPADNKEKEAEDNYARRKREEAKERDTRCDDYILILSGTHSQSSIIRQLVSRIEK